MSEGSGTPRSWPGVRTRAIAAGLALLAATAFGALAPGPDSRVWFAEADANKLVASTAGGTVTEYPFVAVGSEGEAVGPAGVAEAVLRRPW